MSESHQPADDHAEQPQEAARHKKEVHHCQTRTCKQPSSPTQVKLKTTSSIILNACSICSIIHYFLYMVILACFIEFRLTGRSQEKHVGNFNCGNDFCIRWCCYVMLHADQDGEKLQALLRLLTELIERVRVVDALSTVPQMYCLAVVEVVRRKMFMRHYREVSAKCYYWTLIMCSDIVIPTGSVSCLTESVAVGRVFTAEHIIYIFRCNWAVVL